MEPHPQPLSFSQRETLREGKERGVNAEFIDCKLENMEPHPQPLSLLRRGE
jgi:hypothetical protein